MYLAKWQFSPDSRALRMSLLKRTLNSSSSIVLCSKRCVSVWPWPLMSAGLLATSRDVV
jgi:hypothetical protein